tara:strand:+ start:7652 stop:7867 length:216 start_codon:yes stop_codon:yes gene_type:complete
MKCEHKNFLTLGKCNNKAVAKISFDFAKQVLDVQNSRVPYGNRMKNRLCCKKHLKLQEENQHIMNLEIEKI